MSRAASASRTRTMRSGSMPGRPAPSAIARGIRPDHDEPVDASVRRPRRRRDGPRRSPRRARASRRARRPPAGQPGQQVERGDHGPRRGVVAVVDDRHATETNELDPVRRRPAGGQARRRSRRRVSPAARPTAAPASALWTDSRPRVGIVTGRLPASVRKREAHPGGPGRLDGLGADVGVGREPVADAPAAERAPMRRTIGSSALRIAAPSAGQRLEQLALGRLDRLERPDPRQVDRLDGGHDADPRPGECGPGRRSRRRCTCPSRGRRPRAPGRGACSVSGRPTSLFWLPSLRNVRKRRPRTAATASLVEVLAMLPVTPTTSGSNRRRQPAGDRTERGERIRDPDDRHVAERARVAGSAARR